MQLATSLIFITAVWSLVDSASIGEDANYSPHLIGGSPVDKLAVKPAVALLLLKQEKKIVSSCEATLIKRAAYAYFITAAECFNTTSNGENFVLRHNANGQLINLYVKTDVKIHPKYNKDTKEHNLAIFSVPDFLGVGDTAQVALRSEETVSVNEPVDVYAWKNITRDSDPENFFELHSIKTNIINSLWCKALYPTSPLTAYSVCVSAWFGKGLEKDQIGTPLLRKDSNGRFVLVGIATVARPWTSKISYPMEFVDIVPYKSWIDSI